MRKFKFISFILIFSVVLTLFSSITPVFAVDELEEIQANAAILYEVNSGSVLYAKNENERVYPASTTKIMTTLLVVEAYERGELSFDETITTSNNMYYDIIVGDRSTDIKIGETFNLKDFIYYAMITSSNEACNILAEKISGDITSFVELMNTRAAELGCANTNFTNAHGLPDENHYTTVTDLSLIINEAIQHELFMDIVSTPTYTIPATDISYERNVANTNKLLIEGNTYYYPYAKGIKTGYTSAAGYCLTSYAEKDGVSLVSIVMNAKSIIAEDETTKTLSFSESKRLLEWGFANYGYHSVLSNSELITEIPVELGDGADSVVVRPSSEITAFLPNDYDSNSIVKNITLNYNSGSEEDALPVLQAPVNEGDIVGSISVEYEGDVLGTVNLIANTSIALSKTENIKSEVKSIFSSIYFKIGVAVVVLIIVLYIVYVIIYNINRKKVGNYTGRKRRRQRR